MSAFRVAREDNQPLSPIGCSPEIATLTTLRPRSRRAPTRVVKRCAEQGSGALKGWNYRGLGTARAHKESRKKRSQAPFWHADPERAWRDKIGTIGERADHVRGRKRGEVAYWAHS